MLPESKEWACSISIQGVFPALDAISPPPPYSPTGACHAHRSRPEDAENEPFTCGALVERVRRVVVAVPRNDFVPRRTVALGAWKLGLVLRMSTFAVFCRSACARAIIAGLQGRVTILASRRIRSARSLPSSPLPRFHQRRRGRGQRMSLREGNAIVRATQQMGQR